MTSIRKWNKEWIFSYGLLIVCAVLITVTGIVFHQNIMRILPLYVSLVVGFLQARASRFSYLLGGCNCILYTIAYISLGLYAMAASALLWSCPLQLITFWRWSKRSYRQSTEFRTMKPLHWLLTVIVFVVGFVVVHFMLDAAESSYRILDNLCTIIGLIVTFLSLLSFREYSWLMLVTSSIGLVLYVIMTLDDPAQSTYLIYGINSMICIVRQFFSVQKLYAEQRGKKSHA
jgi:nicotinamide mononucleotide transporter PnuC